MYLRTPHLPHRSRILTKTFNISKTSFIPKQLHIHEHSKSNSKNQRNTVTNMGDPLNKIGGDILKHNGWKYSWECDNYVKLPPGVKGSHPFRNMHRVGQLSPEWSVLTNIKCEWKNGWQDKKCRRCGEPMPWGATRNLSVPPPAPRDSRKTKLLKKR